MVNSIISAFDQYFELIPATTEELKNEAFKLRYQVYCLEINGLDSKRYPNGMECDDYDGYSAHYLIRHRPSGEYAATTRLILPDQDCLDRLFQLEVYCEINDCSIDKINRRYLGEASRFCVSKEFKKRKNELHTVSAIGNISENTKPNLEERRTFPHLTLGLFSCLIRASHEYNIHYWYAILETPLIRFFSTLGIHFLKIGPPVNIHGERWPCVIKVSDLLDSVAQKDRDIWNMFTNNGQFGNFQTVNLSKNSIPILEL